MVPIYYVCIDIRCFINYAFSHFKMFVLSLFITVIRIGPIAAPMAITIIVKMIGIILTM